MVLSTKDASCSAHGLPWGIKTERGLRHAVGDPCAHGLQCPCAADCLTMDCIAQRGPRAMRKSPLGDVCGCRTVLRLMRVLLSSRSSVDEVDSTSATAATASAGTEAGSEHVSWGAGVAEHEECRRLGRLFRELGLRETRRGQVPKGAEVRVTEALLWRGRRLG